MNVVGAGRRILIVEDDKASGDLQIEEMKAFLRRHNDFMEIALTAVDLRRIVTANSVRWDHDHGFAVYTWTLDTEADLRAARQAGVDGVYTGRPDLARKVFDAPATSER